MQPELIVLAATGGREGSTVAALAAAGLPVAVVNPRQVRDARPGRRRRWRRCWHAAGASSRR
jgi:transposase